MKLLKFVCICIFVSGCTSASFKIPNQRFESPRVAGKTFKGGIGAGAGNPSKIITVQNIETTPPSDSGSQITLESTELEVFDIFSNIVIDFRVGLGESFEISNTGSSYRLKCQFLGSSLDKARAEEWLGAITADSLSSTVTTGSSASSNTSKVEMSGLGGSLILGYSIKKELIFYGTASQLNFSADTSITQVSPANTFNYSGKGDQFNFILGLRKELSNMHASIEWSYNKTTWEDLEAKEFGTYGFMLGYNW